MFTLLLRILKDRKISITVFCLGSMLFMWMYVAMWPSFQSQAEDFTKIMENYPEELMKAMNIKEMSMNTIESFLALENFSIVWPLFIIFLTISFATFCISTDIEKGSIEIILAQPISRTKIFIGRYLAGLIFILLFTTFSILSIFIFAPLHGVDYQPGNHISIFLLSFMFGWALYSIAFLCSSIFSERSKSLMLSGSIVFLMYILNLIANLKDNLSYLKYLSFFYYYSYYDAIVYNSLNMSSFIAFGVTVILCSSAAVIWFNRRDITF